MDKNDDIPDSLIKFIIIALVVIVGLWLSYLGYVVYSILSPKQAPEPPTERENGLILVGQNYLRASVSPVYIHPQVLGILYAEDGSQRAWDEDMAYAIMMAENHGNSDRINWKDWHESGNCWGSYGLFQLACFRGTPEELLDPEINTQLAYELWQREDWHPWSAYKNGQYKKFLNY